MGVICTDGYHQAVPILLNRDIKKLTGLYYQRFYYKIFYTQNPKQANQVKWRSWGSNILFPISAKSVHDYAQVLNTPEQKTSSTEALYV